MGWLNRVGSKLREKYEDQKVISRQRRAAQKIIETKARAAGLQEKEKQSIRYARAMEKAKVDAMIKKKKASLKNQFSVAGRTGGKNPGLFDIMGVGGNYQNQKPKQKTKERIVPIKKGKKIVGYRKIRQKVRTKVPQPPQRFDVVGF